MSEQDGSDNNADKNLDAGAGADANADANKNADAGAGGADAGDKGAGADKGAAGAGGAGAGKDDGADKGGDKSSTLPENWRELAAGNDEKVAALLKRYGSLNGVAKALKEKDDLIRSGKLKRDMPDPKDEKAIAEWRKEQGIPDEPTGYKLPEAVTKRVTDADKPMLSSFTEFAHAKGAPQQVVDIATEWYVSMAEAQAEEQAARDTSATEAAEDDLRKDWAHGEFKSNMTLAKRFMEQAPEVGANWTEARLPDGRRLGDIAKFVAWASDQGRDKFGDATFATEDNAAKHTARKEEIEKVMKTDFAKYREEGLDKEYAQILEKEEKRKK